MSISGSRTATNQSVFTRRAKPETWKNAVNGFTVTVKPAAQCRTPR